MCKTGEGAAWGHRYTSRAWDERHNKKHGQGTTSDNNTVEQTSTAKHTQQCPALQELDAHLVKRSGGGAGSSRGGPAAAAAFRCCQPVWPC